MHLYAKMLAKKIMLIPSLVMTYFWKNAFSVCTGSSFAMVDNYLFRDMLSFVMRLNSNIKQIAIIIYLSLKNIKITPRKEIC